MSSPIATHPTVLTDSSNVFRFWGGWTLVVVTCINCLASLVLLALIHYMIRRGVLKMNLYIWMVFLMSSSCFFWDATFFFELFMYKTNQDAVYQMMCGFFGISVGIWNFFIVAMVYWTSISANKDYHSANMNNGTYLKWLVAVNFVLSATVAVIMQSANHYYAWFIYDVARLLIAGCSILVLIFLAHTLLKTTTKENRYQSPLYHLLRRVALYPIGNIISRLGSIPYDQIYGIPLYAFPKNAGTSQTIVLFLFIVLTPAWYVLTSNHPLSPPFYPLPLYLTLPDLTPSM